MSAAQTSASAQAGARELSGEGVVGRRVGAALIDGVVLFGVWLVVALATGGGHSAHHHASAHTGTGITLAAFGISLLYFFVAEALTGQTIGKKMVGIRVMARDGSRAGAGRVFVRTLLRVIDGLPFAYIVGLISIGASGADRRQRVGDLAAETVVVEDRGLRA